MMFIKNWRKNLVAKINEIDLPLISGSSERFIFRLGKKYKVQSSKINQRLDQESIFTKIQGVKTFNYGIALPYITEGLASDGGKIRKPKIGLAWGDSSSFRSRDTMVSSVEISGNQQFLFKSLHIDEPIISDFPSLCEEGSASKKIVEKNFKPIGQKREFSFTFEKGIEISRIISIIKTPIFRLLNLFPKSIGGTISEKELDSSPFEHQIPIRREFDLGTNENAKLFFNNLIISSDLNDLQVKIAVFDLRIYSEQVTEYMIVPNASVSQEMCFKPRGLLGHFEVSENLSEPLLPPKISGKNYRTIPKVFNKETKVRKSVGNYAKAYSREKTSINSSKTTSLTFWDLLYPILMPSLNFSFGGELSEFFTKNQLYPFQYLGVEFLIKNRSALLADEMGTGKTVMSTVALKLMFRKGIAKKALIVCPVSLIKVWQDHLLFWAEELHLTVVRGTPETRALDWKYPAHIYLTTYDVLASDFIAKIKKSYGFSCPNCNNYLSLGGNFIVDDENGFTCPYCSFLLDDFRNAKVEKKSLVSKEDVETFDLVLLDEAQYIKNPSSDRSRAIKLINPEFRWALTGTPIENKLEDLGAIFNFVKPKLLTTVSNSSLSIKNAIAPHFLRRLKKDVMPELPEKTTVPLWLELDSDQEKEYKKVLNHERGEIEKLGDSVTKIHIFSVITKLKQVCNFANGKEKSPKTTELLRLVEEIKLNNQKVIVFSQYVEQGVDKLSKLLEPFGIATIKGGMNDSARNSAIDGFKENPEICVFLATLKTGGVGLTLTEASYVIHFDHWWNPALMWQAEDRVHRSGQKSSKINIYSFWMQNTIEERIHQILDEKKILFDEIINGLSDEEIDKSISTDEWLDILGVKKKS